MPKAMTVLVIAVCFFVMFTAGMVVADLTRGCP